MPAEAGIEGSHHKHPQMSPFFCCHIRPMDSGVRRNDSVSSQPPIFLLNSLSSPTRVIPTKVGIHGTARAHKQRFSFPQAFTLAR